MKKSLEHTLQALSGRAAKVLSSLLTAEADAQKLRFLDEIGFRVDGLGLACDIGERNTHHPVADYGNHIGWQAMCRTLPRRIDALRGPGFRDCNEAIRVEYLH